MRGPTDHPRIPETVDPLPVPPLSYDSFEDVTRIGSGGDADVYRATVVTGETSVPVALKEPRIDETIRTDVMERFETEAETWAGLDDHDNVVTVYDWAASPALWIALEYMDGGTLTGRVGNADLAESLWLVGRIAEGVRHGHRHGIAHLDLKPSNLLLRETRGDAWPYPKVSDWGLARLLLEHSNSIEGMTPQYAAPEQFDPDRFGQPDDFTDIYQLAAVLYALLTGDPPFTGSATTVMRKAVGETPTPPSAVDSSVPSGVDDVVLRALSKDRHDRFETVVDFRRAVDDLFETHCTGGGSVSSGSTSTAGVTGPGRKSTDSFDSESEKVTEVDSSPSRTTRSRDSSPAASETNGTRTGPVAGTDRSGTDDSAGSRRRLLKYVGFGAIGLGGGGILASRLGGGPNETENGSGGSAGDTGRSPTSTPAETPTPTSTPTPTPTSTPTPNPTVASTMTPFSSAPSKASADRWTHLNGDSAGTNYNPEVAGITDGDRLATRWTRRVAEEDDRNANVSLVAGDTVYVPARGTLYALAREDGSTKWTVDASVSPGFDTIPAVADGTVFAVALDGAILGSECSLVALDATSGDRLWSASYPTDTWYWGPTVVNGHVYVTHGDTVVAFGAENGTQRWQFALDDRIWARPVVHDGRLYVGSVTTSVYAIDASDGTGYWATETGTGNVRDLAAVGDTVFVVDEGRVTALGAESGEAAWVTDAGSNTGFNSVSTSGDLLYLSTLGERGGSVLALSAVDGSVRWRQTETGSVPNPAWNSHLAVGTEGVYFGNGDQTLYALDRSSGDILWQRLNDGYTLGPTLVDGELYVGSKSGVLRAFQRS